MQKTITLHPTAADRCPLFVVDDLQQHARYCNLPCVAGSPYFRFYAGTPLTTSNGINIGSLYVIDPRPNIRLTATHRETLGLIATAVMEYLDTSRQSLESSRLTKLLSGLNSFAQGEVSSGVAGPLSRTSSTSDLDRSPTPSPPQTPPVESNCKDALPNGDIPPIAITPKVATMEDSSAGALHDDPPSHRRVSTFQRAAHLMRESLDLGDDGGVVIFDVNDLSEVDPEEDVSAELPGASRMTAHIRAMSIKGAERDDVVEDPSAAVPATQMDRRFLKRMMHRFRKGALWYFHQDGTTFSSDEEASRPSCDFEQSELASQSSRSLDPRSQGTLREKDLQLLQKYFPRATRIIFAPLWDSFNSRWFGACFCWSLVETRIFSSHVELGGVLGFGASLMVEHSRVLSQEADKKKGDFISSIS